MTSQIFNIDCIELLKSINDETIDLIVTDPPYKITSRGNSGNTGGMLKNSQSMKGKIFKHNDIHVSQYSSEFFRVLKNNSHCYVMCNHKNLSEFLCEFSKAGFKFTKSLIWKKDNKIMGKYYMSQFEYILLFQKGSRIINNCGTSDILEVKNKKTKDENGKNIHDTEKPIELLKILIENSSNEGDLVLEPFAGSGSTLYACQELKRNFISSEIDETYYQYIKERLK